MSPSQAHLWKTVSAPSHPSSVLSPVGDTSARALTLKPLSPFVLRGHLFTLTCTNLPRGPLCFLEFPSRGAMEKWAGSFGQ